MSYFTPLSTPPKTPLAVYRVLCPNAGIHVSPLVLGAMSIGDKWVNEGMGAMDKASSFNLLDAFYDAGGNFIDTANNYQEGTSEEFIGEWMEQRKIRGQMVIATKYSTCSVQRDPNVQQKVLYTGNSIKNMHMSVEASLKRLKTDYIDIFYVHWWDYATSIKEVMDGLHTLVQSGKVLYLGISDAPAWVVSQANEYARNFGKSQFVIYQGPWNVMMRDLEREILPMARANGMAIAPWNVLAAGKLRSFAEEKKRQETGEGGRTMFGDWKKTPDEIKMTEALEKVAAEIGEGIDTTAIAIAYLNSKAPYVFPMIGGRKVEHLHNNIKALEIHLSSAQIKYLEGVLSYDPGLIHSFFGDQHTYGMTWAPVAHLAPRPATLPVGRTA